MQAPRYGGRPTLLLRPADFERDLIQRVPRTIFERQDVRARGGRPQHQFGGRSEVERIEHPARIGSAWLRLEPDSLQCVRDVWVERDNGLGGGRQDARASIVE